MVIADDVVIGVPQVNFDRRAWAGDKGTRSRDLGPAEGVVPQGHSEEVGI